MCFFCLSSSFRDCPWSLNAQVQMYYEKTPEAGKLFKRHLSMTVWTGQPCHISLLRYSVCNALKIYIFRELLHYLSCCLVKYYTQKPCPHFFIFNSLRSFLDICSQSKRHFPNWKEKKNLQISCVSGCKYCFVC